MNSPNPSPSSAIEFNQLGFRYVDQACNEYEVFPPFSLSIPAGSGTLLIGANGVGKSTLLRILAGRHIVPESALAVFGQSPFFGLSLSSDIALIDSDFPINLDIRVQELLEHKIDGIDIRRQNELIELLGVKLDWRMCRVSEGQRRRVQLLLSLRRSVKLLLLDEVTAHLDVLMRADLIQWLRGQTEKTGLTIIYATHILDGLWLSPQSVWPTHVLSMKFSELPKIIPISEVPAIPLLTYCENEIREDLRRSATLTSTN